MLTTRQAETLFDIHESWGVSGTFTPREVYPGRTNKDSAGRRTIRTLADRGLLARIPEHPASGREMVWYQGSSVRYQITGRALEEFDRYAQKVGYEFPWQ